MDGAIIVTRTVDQTVDALTGEYDIGRAGCTAAVIELVGDVAERRLVRV